MCKPEKDYFHHWSSVSKHASAFTFPAMCPIPVYTHPVAESCFAEAHNSQTSGCPLDYLERNVPPSQVAHRFSLRSQRTEMGQRHSHANLLHHQQHLSGQKGKKYSFIWSDTLNKITIYGLNKERAFCVNVFPVDVMDNSISLTSLGTTSCST